MHDGLILPASLEPGGDLLHQRVAQAGMLDALHRLADEGLDQQRLGFLGRNAARLEVEQQVLVEVARGGAVAALHVVGEDFELRLVVGLGGLRQQQRVRRHLGVGLLRLRPHDDLALEHAAALVVEHRLEHLAAGAVAGHVVGDQRGVGMLAAPEQARAADAGDGALAVEAHEQLVAHHRAAGGEQELVEARHARRSPPSGVETCSAPAPAPVILIWSTWASSPTSSSSAVLT